MKRYRKLRTALLAVLLVLACVMSAACGPAHRNEPTVTEGLPVLKVGSDEYAPYFYRDINGDFTGIDVELAQEACRRIGYRAEFVEIEWSEKEQLLEAGEVDCLWGSFSMTGREEQYLWAGPYMKSRQVIAVPSESGIMSFADLAGKRIGVQMTSKPDEILSSGSDERIPALRELYCFSNLDYAFAAMRKGYVDAVAGHEVAFLEYMKATSGTYRILPESLIEVDLGVAFFKGGNQELAKALCEALSQMQEDGFTAQLLQRYGLDAHGTLEDDGT